MNVIICIIDKNIINRDKELCIYKKVTLHSYKYNIILLNKKNNIIHRLLLTEMKNFVFTKK